MAKRLRMTKESSVQAHRYMRVMHLEHALRALLATFPTCSDCGRPATNSARYLHGCDEHRKWPDDFEQAGAIRQAEALLAEAAANEEPKQ